MHNRLPIDDVHLDVTQGTKVRLRFNDGRIEKAAIPEPVGRFLESFNQGSYPELEVSSDNG
jgi:hypothetical protein